MIKKKLVVLAFLFTLNVCYAQVVKTKVIDNGSNGNYKSIAVTEKFLPDFVVYRPKNINEAVKKEGKLPVLVWANGGCMNSSIHHERLLSEVASHGYIIIAIGKLQMTVEERVHEHTPDDELLKAIDWISKQANLKGTDYYKNVDLEKLAAGGQSCGGAQTFRIAQDSRIKTYLIFNAGMGDMTMAGASTKSLKNLHGKIVYIIGGESDVAYANAILDYDRIENVPVAFANHKTAGHGGTFAQEFGGSFASMALDWLDWQFKGKDKTAIFLKNDLSKYPGWTMKAKGFETQPQGSTTQQFIKPELEFTCELKVTIDQPMDLGATFHGKRIIIPISGGTFEGPRLKGTVLKGGADYQYVGMNGARTELNAIYTIKTDDNVLIQVQNAGLIYATKEKNASGLPEVYFKAAPRFEAPIDSKYAWLNNAIFICNPVIKDGYISIQVWKVL